MYKANVIDLDVFKTPCKGCGQLFVNLQGRKFCTTPCREAFYRAEVNAIRETLEPIKAQVCIGCGCEFTGRKRKYCSRECNADALRKKDAKSCVTCGVSFVSPKADRCRDCRIIYERQRQHQAAIRRRRESGVNPQAFCDTQMVGAKGEMIFDLLCCCMKWISCKPMVEQNPGFDRVLIRNGTMTRVQVKALTASRFEDGDGWELGGGYSRLDFSRFDELAVVDVETADVWIIPASLVGRKVYVADHERFNPFD